MNCVDSCGWLEYFSDGVNADFFAPAIENRSDLIMPVVCIYEVYKRILIDWGKSEAIKAVTTMQQSKVIELSTSLALYAASLSCDLKLPMADSIVLATARRHDALLWTQDKDFENITGVKYISKG